jgi:quinoprotein dehydrogenase-associated probable ABC transporter substrate-binding protein
MSSRCRERSAARRHAASLACAVLAAFAAAPAGAEPLRVCSDPDNLPLSRADGSGFENRIAALLAEELGRPLQTHWTPLWRGFVRKTIGEGLCDVLVGVPAGFERLTTTRPYYRSAFVIVTRGGDVRALRDLDDPRLSRLRIGVQLPGDGETPPAHALARHGAVDRVVGYPSLGDTPSAWRAVQGVQSGELDVALLWGPQAGWFAAHATPPLDVRIAKPPADVAMPFEFAIAVGVRKGDTALRDALQGALDRRRGEVDAILAAYSVPRSDAPEAAR